MGEDILHTEPGMLPAPHDQFRLIGAFRARFRVREPKGTIETPGWVVPTWSALGDEAEYRTNAVLHSLTVPDTRRVFLLVEYPYPGHVYRAPFGEVRAFFDHEPEKDRVFWRNNRYVFPEDLSWCVAFTSEYVDGAARYWAWDRCRSAGGNDGGLADNGGLSAGDLAPQS